MAEIKNGKAIKILRKQDTGLWTPFPEYYPTACWRPWDRAGIKIEGAMGKKRICLYLAAAVLLALVISGCGNKHIDNQAMEEEFENAPEWVLTGHEKEEEELSGVGVARIGEPGIQFAKTAATVQARNELARQLSVRINSLVNSVSRQAGTGEGRSAQHLASQISRQVAKETLIGSRQKDIWISPSSDLYVLVVMDKEQIKGAVRKQMDASFREDADKWKAYEDKDGTGELDKKIDNLF